MTKSKTHFILQTGYVDFFSNICWHSMSMLELANPNDTYVIIGFVKQMEEASYRLRLQGKRHNVVYVNMLDFSQYSLRQIMSKLEYVVKQFGIDTINIFNGACNSLLHVEQEHFTRYNAIIANNDVYECTQLKDVCINVYQQIMFVLYALIEVGKQRNNAMQINNFVEDPLQHKLWYINDLNIKHFYFHNLQNEQNIYSHIIQHYDMHTDVLDTKFDFSPSQQYPYLHNATFNFINRYKTRKHLQFGFAMTNVWKDRNDRTDLINKFVVADLHNANAVKRGIVFRFFSRAKNQQAQSDKLLPYNTYIELMKSSKFTLIVPSYDSDCFSLRRFAEAISVGCIPLIHHTCKLYMFDDDMQRFIKQTLIVKDSDIETFDIFIANLVDLYDKILLSLWKQPFIQQYIKDDLYVESLKQAKLL